MPEREYRRPVPAGTHETVAAAIVAGRVTVPAKVVGDGEKRPTRKWKDRTEAVSPDEAPDAYLWAYRTGPEAGVVVLDFDGEAGAEALRRSGLQAHRRTGSGGYHVEVVHPGWHVKTVAGVAEGVDVRGDGGLAYFAGASHKGEYVALSDRPPYRPDEVPQWLRQASGLDTAPAPRAVGLAREYQGEGLGTEHGLAMLDYWLDKVRSSKEGTRNQVLNRAAYAVAGLVAAGSLDEAHARAQIEEAGHDVWDGDVEAVVESAWVAGEAQPYELTETGADGARPVYTMDALGAAQWFVDLHGSDVRYIADMGVWSVWDGQRWVIDASEIQERAKGTVQAIHAAGTEAMAAGNSDEAKLLSRLAVRMSERVATILKLASSDPRVVVTSSALDRDPHLLNTPGGTVDLRTGKMRAHSRADLITKLCRATPNATPGAWQAYLDKVLPELDIQAYLRRLAGYSAIAGATEKAIIFLVGEADTGKSKAVAAIAHALGDYSQTVQVSTFTDRGGNTEYALASLHGARFVGASEFEERARANVSLIKQLTGGDRMVGRHPYGRPFSFSPACTVWISTNHFPHLADDSAAWRRVQAVPFNHPIPRAEQDTGIADKLAAASAEVLAWVVQGAVEYRQAGGFATPAAAGMVAQELREQQDPVALFIREECGSGGEVECGVLYDSFRRYCLEQGEKWVPNQRTFSNRIARLGYTRRKSNGSGVWVGLTLDGTSLGRWQNRSV